MGGTNFTGCASAAFTLINVPFGARELCSGSMRGRSIAWILSMIHSLHKKRRLIGTAGASGLEISVLFAADEGLDVNARISV